MATSASQTYITKLGFQDKDRGNNRHGLACEYLFNRLLELEVVPYKIDLWKSKLEKKINWRKEQIARTVATSDYFYGRLTKEEITEFTNDILKFESELNNLSIDFVSNHLAKRLRVGECVNVPIASRSYVNGFADVLIPLSYPGEDISIHWLGEVKITKEPAENVIQQINFYLNYIKNVEAVYILADYDPSDLQRLCVGTKIKVFQLGSRFEQWVSSRVQLVTNEL